MTQKELLQKCEQMLQNRCTPEIINDLKENEVFVFGSKPEGHHKSGAAKIAVEKFGAIEGIGEGFAGQSYAIPVHRHRTELMKDAVTKFIKYAKGMQDKMFYVLPIGCGNAGMDVRMVANMFKGAVELDNVFMPAMFIKAIRQSVVIPESEELPIKYVDEVINADRLRGRLMGLMAEISKRTDKPITFDDELLKEDNIFLHAYIRIIAVATKEEQRVMGALLDEAKRMSESGLGAESDNGTVRALELVIGWKSEANKIFEEGGSMYDLLSFTANDYLDRTNSIVGAKGYQGKIECRGLVRYEENGLYGLKDEDGNIVISCEYEMINHSGWAGRGWHLKKNGKWGAVNERGEWMFDVEYDNIKTRYEGGHFLRKNGKVGFCDSEGKMAIDFLYDELENYQSSWEGAKAKLNGKYGYVNGEGKVTVPIEYDRLELENDGMIKVEKEAKYGLLNKNADVIIPIEYEELYLIAGVVKVIKGGKYGVVDLQDKIILPFEYEWISVDSVDSYRVKKNGLCGIIDKESKILFPYKYRDLGAFDNNGVTYAENYEGLYGYIDKDDNVIIPFQYERARDFDGDYAEVGMGWNEYGIIDKKGNVVVPMKYYSVFIRWDGIVEVGVDDSTNRRYLRGLYDLKNGSVLPCIYERISTRGRDRDGIMECECWKNSDDEPVVVKVKNESAFSQNAIVSKCRRIAIARDFAVVINENARELTLVGHNPDFRNLCRSVERKFIKVAAGFDGYMALTDRGDVIAGPRAREFECGHKIERLNDVIDITGCEGHTVALHSNGTVTCIDEPASYEGPEPFADKVLGWHNIIQVACGYDFVAGLKSDGTLVSTGRYYRCPDLKDIAQFDAFNCYYGQIHTIALLKDGRVVTDYTDEVSDWKNVVSVRVGNNGYAVGLKSDGTAYAIGNERFESDIKSWRNIVEIECKFDKAVAILQDGSIVSTGF